VCLRRLTSHDPDSGDEMHELMSVSDSSCSDQEFPDDADDDDAWFSEVAEDDGWQSDTNNSEAATHDKEPKELAAAIITDDAEPLTHTEIYDSGCSVYITPYQDRLENYSKIPPKTLNTANKQDFRAVGKGKMVIEVLNGVETSELRLTEVLYSPEVGYTLVSIGKLDECGFECSFGGGKCRIFARYGNKLGEISRNSRGLYKHISEPLSANAAIELVTLDLLLKRNLTHLFPNLKTLTMCPRTSLTMYLPMHPSLTSQRSAARGFASLANVSRGYFAVKVLVPIGLLTQFSLQVFVSISRLLCLRGRDWLTR
jgi:hypothetical protein